MITLYTVECRNCLALEKLLEKKNIPFEKNTDKELMLKKGFKFLPMVEKDGQLYNFTEAIQKINGGDFN